MGTVAVHRIGSQGELAKTSQNSVILVDSQGCRNPSMRGVCPEQPRQVTPLITTLPFRAFMFQESKSGDEMVLSVRMIGCLQFQDCHQVSFTNIPTCDNLSYTSCEILADLNCHALPTK